jgi:uncharacterized protein DUF6049
VRSAVRALGLLTAVLLAAAGPLVAVVPAAQASAGQFQHQSARTGSAVSQPLAISITGMTPTVAGPNSTITLHGTLANHTGSALGEISVQAMTSFASFGYPQQMTDFTDGTSAGTATLQLQQAGDAYQVPASVPNRTTVSWTVSFQAAEFYGQFGVFPVDIQVTAAGTTYTVDARTFLTFWPGGASATQPKGLQVAWVWPLIDTPQQGACPKTLATSELAGSVAAGGRLNTLLDAGSAWALKDDLTWDVDPALLSDVSVMTRSYFTNGNYVCSERRLESPSKAASAWLSQLRTSTAGAQAFLTPYANVDVAALSHAGLEPSIAAAYQVGDTVAGQILPGTFGKNGTGTGDGAVLRAAWPTDGQADTGVLTSLADDGGISTVILSSDGEDALAKTINGVGTSMSVLLASSRITSLLGTASATASQAGQFTFTQDFLAQTAMIAAELPNSARSLVIAPPTGWDPSPAEANALLSITNEVPWLHSVDLSTLATAAAKQSSTTHVPPKQVSGAELSGTYLDHLAPVRASDALFKDLLYQPSPQTLDSLTAALAATESSAWRGRGSPGGWLAMSQLQHYLTYAEGQVQMIASTKILLAGQSGKTAVSVRNGLAEPVEVQVMATTPVGSNLQVLPYKKLLVVQAGKTNTVYPPVHSTAGIGTATVQLQLVTRNGLPLTGKGTSQSLSVEVTRFGRLLLILIGGALGILVVTSAYRLRRKRLAGVRNGGSANENADAGGAG